ncbi:uncharacterized protein LOC111229426 isoform X2 [Seriola dumerili]|uniref:uncharacterized protein LOC111229426 isoform X2 n=1 Tax=Seriola dumerili TaxID=41447 RepID=UPI000BBF19F8|nr:uncharacterized protein LOC111229426 isoform X2 [Seriola dumerili]
MFCRRAWQRVGPLARRAFKPTPRNAAPVRHMAFGVPGGSTNMTYFLLCGGGLTAAVVYAYKTVNGDSERYEDRLANMGSPAKASSAPEAAEPAPVEEAAPAIEVVSELVPADAETAAEPVVEAVSEEASEVTVIEAQVEPAVTEEAAPPAAIEEAAPGALEVVAAVETPAEAPAAEAPAAEAPAAESAESMPDLLTAVKILASSTVEIAAASVGETSLVEAVRQMEEEGKGLDSTLEVVEGEILEVTAEVVAKEAAEEPAVVVSEEELKTAEAGAVEEVADAEAVEALSAEEVMTEEASAPAAAEEEAAASLPVEDTASTPTVEEAGAVTDEDQTADPEAAPEEAVSSTEASPEDTAEEVTPAEEATTTAEAAPENETLPDEMTPAADTSVEEGADEASAEETAEVGSAFVDTAQLAAASTGSDLEVLSAAEPEPSSEAPVHEAKHCHSCHSAPSAGEEEVPPAALGEELVSEGEVDLTHEAKEVVSLVEGQTTETMMVVTAQS